MAVSRDRALRGGVHELGVLGQNATGIARGKRFPTVTAGTQLGLIDDQVESASGDIDPYQITIAHEGDGTCVHRFGSYVADAQAVVPPENRPSVNSSTSFPSPAPLMAAVIASISRMPGRPSGPRSG